MNTDDIECPRCKTTKYRNPQLKLLVNICGHPLCEKCIELMFATGSAKCYQCPTPLKRGNFKKQLFQDSQVEKDIQVRRDIIKKYGKNQNAFDNLRAYNDYLEKLETVIYNKANDIDRDETDKLLDELRKLSSANSLLNTIKSKPQEIAYFHKIEPLNSEGPELPVIDEKFIRSMRAITTAERAGGFTAELAIRRVMSEAFNNLFSR